MDIKETLTIGASLLTILGVWQFIYLFNLGSNKRIEPARAFDIERKAIIEDCNRVQEELNDLKKQCGGTHADGDNRERRTLACV